MPTFQINPDPYHIPPADDKTISTEGCFSCKVRNSIIVIRSRFIAVSHKALIRTLRVIQVNGNGNGRHRRAAKNRSAEDQGLKTRTRNKKRRHAVKPKRHHHGMEHTLKINLRQTRHRTRIIKLQSAIKVTLSLFRFRSIAK